MKLTYVDLEVPAHRSIALIVKNEAQIEEATRAALEEFRASIKVKTRKEKDGKTYITFQLSKDWDV